MRKNAMDTFQDYFSDEYSKYYDTDLIVTESNNNLIKPGDIMNITVTDYYCKECEKCLVVKTNMLPNDVAWKFAFIGNMLNSKDFDNMDWRQELDDIRNLGFYNYFHLGSFAKLMDSIKLKISDQEKLWTKVI